MPSGFDSARRVSLVRVPPSEAVPLLPGWVIVQAQFQGQPSASGWGVPPYFRYGAPITIPA